MALQQMQQGGFTGTVSADQSRERSGFQGQRDIINNDMVAVGDGKTLGNKRRHPHGQ